MTTSNNIVAIQIPPADVQAVITKLNEINALLKPYLVALTAEERKQLPKMSEKTVSFVQKSLEYALINPEFAPPYLSVPDLQIDMKAVEDLTSIMQLLQPLCDNVNDTEMMSGSEAYVAALTYYNSIKTAAKRNVTSSKAIADDLKKRFERTSKPENKP